MFVPRRLDTWLLHTHETRWDKFTIKGETQPTARHGIGKSASFNNKECRWHCVMLCPGRQLPKAQRGRKVWILPCRRGGDTQGQLSLVYPGTFANMTPKCDYDISLHIVVGVKCRQNPGLCTRVKLSLLVSFCYSGPHVPFWQLSIDLDLAIAFFRRNAPFTFRRRCKRIVWLMWKCLRFNSIDCSNASGQTFNFGGLNGLIHCFFLYSLLAGHELMWF